MEQILLKIFVRFVMEKGFLRLVKLNGQVYIVEVSKYKSSSEELQEWSEKLKST